MAAPVHEISACRTLFVRNLPLETSNEDLDEFFGEIGPVKRCFVIRDKDDDGHKCKGYGYVTFSAVEDAEKALGKVKSYNGRKLYLSYSDKRSKRENQKKAKPDESAAEGTSPATVKVRPTEVKDVANKRSHAAERKKPKIPLADLELSNLPAGTSEKSLKKYLRKIRNIESVVFPVYGDSGLCATIQFEHKAGATNALKTLEARKLEGHDVSVFLKEVARRDRRPATDGAPTPAVVHGIVIRNLSFRCNEDKLRKEFKRFGPVSRAFIATKDGKKLGCAFVDFHNKTDATKAIEHMNGTELHERRIAVDWAMGKKEYNLSQSTTAARVTQDVNEDVVRDDGIEEAKKSFDDDEDDDDDDEEEDEEGSDDAGEEMSEEEEETEDEEEEGEDRDLDGGDEDDSEMEENASPKKKKKPRKRDEGPSDVEEGRTLFIRNLSYDTEEEDLEELMMEFGELEYCRIVIDQSTERSKGVAFVKFAEKEDAEKCLEKANDETKLGGLTLDKRKLSVALAVDRSKAKELAKPKENEKEDKRNLHLVREGMVRPGTQSAQGVSQTDLEKRMKCEKTKRAKLKNPNIFISATRLCVHNIPTRIDDQALKKIFLQAVGEKRAKITECRIMRDLERVNAAGVGKSRGYGFVAFSTHDHALKALRNVNNNAQIFDPNKRPIVEFSLENKRALDAKQRRMERLNAEQAQKLSTKPGRSSAHLAPAPTDAEGKKMKVPRGLPSHWGPKVRHNRPKPQRIPNKPKGKITRKQSVAKIERNDQLRPQKQQQSAAMNVIPKPPKAKAKRGKKRKHESDAFDKLVSNYKAKIQGGVKKGKWFD